MPISAPTSEKQLMQRAEAIAGLSIAELAQQQKRYLPQNDLLHAKGLVGQLLEQALGATAGSKSEPDFQKISVELKTMPIDNQGRPTETTYVCVVPLTDITNLHWHESSVYKKLARVLWMPIQADADIPIHQRRIGMPMLWSPSEQQEAILRQDWEEFMEMISLGQVDSITGHQGQYLQIRPKAANSKALTAGIGPDGSAIQTLPRGFYLRTQFTQAIISSHYI